MAIRTIGLMIGILVLGAGVYYLIKEKRIRNPEGSTPWSARPAA